LSSTQIDAFNLKYTSINAWNAEVAPAFSSDKKIPLGVSLREGIISGNNVESEPAVNWRNASPDPVSQSSRRASSTGNVANSPTPSIATTLRQQRLQEQEQASVSQLASLEARISSAEWVHISRAEYDATAAEMSRLRAEASWLRDAQQSDWALGLSDEMPPPYSHATVEYRQ
jgi:hypothetical protein